MFLTGMPSPYKLATENVAFEGAIVDIDEGTGRARSMKAIRRFID